MKKILYLFLIVSIISCKDKKLGKVINSDNTEKYSEVKKIKLDDTYNNLLNPKFSSDEEYKEVRKSWNSFHQQIGKIVKKNKFDWEIKDSSITVMNKIYFNNKGEVEYYIFRIRNKNISSSKKEEYQQLLSNNISSIRIDLKRENQFAQCGKVKYMNK